MLEIFPQNVTLFPNDKQLFTARATPPPPLWKITGGGGRFVQPDFSVRISQVTSVPGVIVADLAENLISGLGALEFILDPDSLPTGSGELEWQAISSKTGGGLWEYRVRIQPTQILIDNEASATLATLQHSAASGDVFRIECGSGFRLFVNNVLRHERVSGFSPGITYPIGFHVIKDQPGGGGSNLKIPPPRLSGDWRLVGSVIFGGSEIVTFVAPSHGSISHIIQTLQAEYFNGTVPGQYKLVATIDPGADSWMEDAVPTGASQSTSGGDAWNFVTTNPTPQTGTQSHKSNNVAGDHAHTFTGATATLQINPGDILYCWVFPDTTNPTTEIMLEWGATDASGFAHRAYWGANSLTQGTDGTPTRRFMGALPTAGQWTRLEVPASLVDLEGRVLNGMTFRLFNGQCSFDQAGKIPGLQRAEAIITIPPLQILGELTRTLQPGQKVRFQTNYDVAQTANLVTLSIVSGGGSLSQGEFTAPTTPGTTVVRATASVGNQVADITINVPPVISPNFFAAAALETIDWEINVLTTPEFVSAGTMAEGVGNITPGLPAGTQEKDILLLIVQSANENVPTPLGWVAVADSPQSIGTAGAAGSTRLSAFWKRAVASETAPLVTDPGDHAIAQIFAFRGCGDTGNPWNVTAGDTAASSTAVSIPGDTTTVPNCLVVLAVANATDTAAAQTSGYVNADLANLTERGDVNTIQGVGGGFALITGQKTTAGAYGATTATLATASAQARMSIALRPVTVVWTASAGSINSSSGLWTAPSLLGQTAKITATAETFTATRDVLILEKFPIDPSAPIRWERRKTVLVSRAEDRSRVARVKDKGGLAFEAFEVSFNNKEIADLGIAHDFWDRHHPAKRFIFEDKVRGIRKIVYFDSDISHEVESSCAVNFSFRIIEA